MGQPVAVRNTDFVPTTGGVQLRPHGFAEPGYFYPASDGIRLMYGRADTEVFYMLAKSKPTNKYDEGRIYRQNQWSFSAEVGQFGGIMVAAEKLSATKSVISDFLDIYLGCMAVAGGPVAWGITGMNLAVATGKIVKNYHVYAEALRAISEEDVVFYKKMPVFYEHMIVELLLARIKQDVRSAGIDLATESLIPNKAVGKIVGVFLGKIGEEPLKKYFKAFRQIIDQVLLKVADHAITGGTVEENQARMLADHHLVPQYATASFISLRQDRAMEIVFETARNAKDVRPRLARISKALAALES